ncbi:MAG: autoinducer binding domain-containing protein [Pseudomonadota bacterium]
MKPLAEVLNRFNARFADTAQMDVDLRARVALQRLENMGTMGMAASFGFTETNNQDIYSNYSTEWLEYYAEKEFLYNDPVAVYGLTNIGFVTWEYLEENAAEFGCTADVFTASRKFGMESGTAFSLKIGQRRTVASVSHRKNVNDAFRREIYALLFDITLDLYPELYSSVNRSNITSAELDVIKLMSQDHRDQEISDLLHIAIQTVRSRRRTAMEKLDARTITGVVAKAKDAGYI